MATLAGRRAVRADDPGGLRPPAVGQLAGADLAGRPRRDRRVDVGRGARPDLCRQPAVERLAADPDPRRRRHAVRVPAWGITRAWPPLRIAGGARDLRRLYRAGARRAADHRAFHGLGDAAVVLADRDD